MWSTNESLGIGINANSKYSSVFYKRQIRELVKCILSIKVSELNLVVTCIIS